MRRGGGYQLDFDFQGGLFGRRQVIGTSYQDRAMLASIKISALKPDTPSYAHKLHNHGNGASA